MWLVSILVMCCIFDMIHYKIPNLIVIAGMITGLVTSDIKNVMNAVLIFVILYPFFMIKGLGAGDIKLMMMVGCFLNWKTFITGMAISMIIASAVSIIKIMINKECRNRLIYLAGYCKRVAYTGVIDNYEVDKNDKKIMVRLSVPILCGVLITLLF